LLRAHVLFQTLYLRSDRRALGNYHQAVLDDVFDDAEMHAVTRLYFFGCDGFGQLKEQRRLSHRARFSQAGNNIDRQLGRGGFSSVGGRLWRICARHPKPAEGERKRWQMTEGLTTHRMNRVLTVYMVRASLQLP